MAYTVTARTPNGVQNKIFNNKDALMSWVRKIKKGRWNEITAVDTMSNRIIVQEKA